jgi:hypothetical protein
VSETNPARTSAAVIVYVFVHVLTTGMVGLGAGGMSPREQFAPTLLSVTLTFRKPTEFLFVTVNVYVMTWPAAEKDVGFAVFPVISMGAAATGAWPTVWADAGVLAVSP